MAAPDLTTTDAVKLYLSLATAAQDALIGGLVTSVSEKIQSRLSRTLAQVAAVTRTERAPDNSAVIILQEWPVDNLVVTEDGEALVEDTDYEVLDLRRLVRISGNDEIRWLPKSKVVITADEGYSPVPADLELAAREQTVFAFKQANTGGRLLGVASKTSGAGGAEETFVEYMWLPSVLEVIDSSRYRRYV